FHAVCMPYLGPVTLADALRGLQERRSLPDSGKALAETLRSRRSPSLPDSREPDSAAGSGTAPPEPATAPGLKTLEGLSYVEAVRGLGARLADGLAHAHERGIRHRDLKPANVLLADDGQPMLLDFNLAEDTKLRSGAPAAFVGGTLPYMAPEQLAAFLHRSGGVDARGDVYALG